MSASAVLFGAAWTVLTALACGVLTLRRAHLPFSRLERLLFEYIVGSAVLSTAMLVIGVVRLPNAAQYVIASFAVVAVAFGGAVARRVKPLARHPRVLASGALGGAADLLLGAGDALRAASDRLLSGADADPAAGANRRRRVLARIAGAAACAVLLAFGAFYLITAMMPETSPDGMYYHLGLVMRYVRHQQIDAVPYNMYAQLPEGLEMLFVAAFLLGGHSATALVHLAFLLALAAFAGCYARRYVDPGLALAAAVAVFVVPVIGMSATCAYNDAAAACAVFAAVYALRTYLETRNTPMLAIAGVCCGFAYAIKPTAAIVVLFAAVAIAWDAFRNRRFAWKAVAGFAVCAVAVIAPWLVKNVAYTGNPFSPFLNALFPNPVVQPWFERGYVARMRNYGLLKDAREWPLEVTVRGEKLQGLLGPMMLAAPLALVALRKREGRFLLGAAAVLLLPYPANLGTRFLIPAVAPLLLAMLAALASMRLWLAWTFVFAHALLSWPTVVPSYCERYAWRIDYPVWRAAKRRQKEVDYLRQHVANFVMIEYLNKVLPANALIYSFDGLADAYVKRDMMGYYEGALNERLREQFYTPLQQHLHPVRRASYPFRRTAVRAVKFVVAGAKPENVFGINEVTFYDAGQQRPNHGAQVRTNCNRWDAGLVVDGNPVTRWRNWQDVPADLFISIEFPAPMVVDEVRVQHANDTSMNLVALVYQDAGGTWSAPVMFASDPEEPVDEIALRRAAIADMRHNGVTHLSIAEDRLGAPDIIERPQDWGVRTIVQSEQVHVFELPREGAQ